MWEGRRGRRVTVVGGDVGGEEGEEGRGMGGGQGQQYSQVVMAMSVVCFCNSVFTNGH